MDRVKRTLEPYTVDVLYLLEATGECRLRQAIVKYVYITGSEQQKNK
jgi:hypothetical protein